MTFAPPPHWAPRDAPACASDAKPPSTAPRGGGAVSQPAVSSGWEWQVNTDVAAAPGDASPPPPSSGAVVHCGGCHCGLVRFEVDAPSDLTVWDCNCSDCRMRRNAHFVVPKAALRLTSAGAAAGLAEYRWGTGVARHLFCARCGICPFYAPRSNPDGWAITFACLDGGTVSSVDVRRFDGLHWEDFIAGEGSAIKAFSAEAQPDAAGAASADAYDAAAGKESAATPQ